MTTALTVIALAGVWLLTTGGRLTGDQLVILEAEEARQAQLERRVAAALKVDFPELMTAPPASPNLRSTLERLLSRSAQASSERRAAMLLAAHFLTLRFAPTDPPSREEIDRPPRPIERAETIAGHRIRYVWGPLGTRWISDWGLMRTVWREHPDTTLGEAAFVELLARGWRDNPLCDEGTDDFREVIREGERFLSRSPRSTLRRDVVTTLGWAYETWWSLSRATSDPYVTDRTAYAAGADAARTKAIGYYEEALRLGLGGPVAMDARARLAKLRRGIDTDQRIFHCVYD